MMDEPDVAIDNLEQDDSFEEHSHRVSTFVIMSYFEPFLIAAGLLHLQAH